MAQIDRAVLQRPPAGNVTGLKTLLLGFAAVIPAFLVAALLLTWIFGIPIVIQGVRLEQEPFLIAFGYATMAFLYLRDRNSPHRIAAAYLEFLKEQGIEPVPRSGAALLLRAGRLWLSLSSDVRFEILRSLGLEACSARGGQVDARSLTLVSLALFSEGEAPSRTRACKEAARIEDTVRLVFAYLDLAEERAAAVSYEGAPEVSLQDLLRLAPPRIALREGELGPGFHRELKLIRETLSRGEWPVSLPFVLRAAYDPNRGSQAAVSLLQLLRQRPWLNAALQRLFKTLPTAVIDRYLASQQSRAYLLSFKSPRRGELAALLDAVTPAGLPAGPYRFEQYTNNARIGLVPRDWSFEQFAARLADDLRAACARPRINPPQGGEILLHRLGLSGRDYYPVEIPTVTRRQATLKLQRMLASGLEPAELLAVIEYVQDPGELLAGMMDSPLVDFAGPLEPTEAQQLEAAGDELRRALLQALDADTPAALGALLARRDVTVQEVEAAANALIPILAGLWQSVWTIDRLRIVVTNYLETLRDLAALRGGFRPARQIGD